MCTVLVYLNDVASGGCTGFPRLGMRVQPRKGEGWFGPRIFVCRFRSPFWYPVPVPVSGPVMVPVPAPVPIVVSVPAPVPAPVPVSVPAGFPVPIPLSIPSCHSDCIVSPI